MKILFLGPDKKSQRKLIYYLSNDQNIVNKKNEPLDIDNIVKSNYDYAISFGYGYIIKEDIIDYFREKIINLHISFLPWNKGADPNFWSILKNTPKGVTIHQIEKGLDCGKIICQKEVIFDENETFRSTYELLNENIIELFQDNWKKIKNEKLKRYPQIGNGSYHRSADKSKYMDLLTEGWDTKIKDLEGKALIV